MDTALARSTPEAAAAAQEVEHGVLERARQLLRPPAGVELDGDYPYTVLVTTSPREGLDLPLWADGEGPDDYPADVVLNAVHGSTTRPGDEVAGLQEAPHTDG